jgi:hypothetical protein
MIFKFRRNRHGQTVMHFRRRIPLRVLRAGAYDGWSDSRAPAVGSEIVASPLRALELIEIGSAELRLPLDADEIASLEAAHNLDAWRDVVVAWRRGLKPD